MRVSKDEETKWRISPPSRFETAPFGASSA